MYIASSTFLSFLKTTQTQLCNNDVAAASSPSTPPPIFTRCCPYNNHKVTITIIPPTTITITTHPPLSHRCCTHHTSPPHTPQITATKKKKLKLTQHNITLLRLPFQHLLRTLPISIHQPYTSPSRRDSGAFVAIAHEERVLPVWVCADEQVEDGAADVACCACCEDFRGGHFACGGVFVLFCGWKVGWLKEEGRGRRCEEGGVSFRSGSKKS